MGSSDENSYALNHCPNKVFDENGNFNTYLSNDGSVIEFVDEPFIISQLISGITRKPAEQFNEEELDFILEVIARDFVVPLLIDNIPIEELDLNEEDLLAAKKLIEELLLYCPKEIRESDKLGTDIDSILIRTWTSTLDVLLFGNRIIDEVEKLDYSLDMKKKGDSFIAFVKDIVALYNANDYNPYYTNADFYKDVPGYLGDESLGYYSNFPHRNRL